jgi:hypothetical protein
MNFLTKPGKPLTVESGIRSSINRNTARRNKPSQSSNLRFNRIQSRVREIQQRQAPPPERSRNDAALRYLKRKMGIFARNSDAIFISEFYLKN